MERQTGVLTKTECFLFNFKKVRKCLSALENFEKCFCLRAKWTNYFSMLPRFTKHMQQISLVQL